MRWLRFATGKFRCLRLRSSEDIGRLSFRSDTPTTASARRPVYAIPRTDPSCALVGCRCGAARTVGRPQARARPRGGGLRRLLAARRDGAAALVAAVPGEGTLVLPRAQLPA